MNVLEIQTALKSLGIDPGPLDGDMGRQTREAIRRFQADHGLKADGIVGAVTAGALTATAGKASQPAQEGPGRPPAPAATQRPAAGTPVVSPYAMQSQGPNPAGRPIWFVVVHCTATPQGVEFTREQIRQMHLDRGFSDIGYHRLFHLDGRVEQGRADSVVGAHVSNFNTGSLGFSYVGGVDGPGKNAKPIDSRTPEQKAAMLREIAAAVTKYKIRLIVGHRDLSPDQDHDGVVEPWEFVKACPCFDAQPEYAHLLRA